MCNNQRVGTSQAHLKPESVETMRIARNNAEKTIEIVDAVLAGEESIKRMCEENGYSYNMFLYYLKCFAKLGTDYPSRKEPKLPEKEYTEAERFYSKAFGIEKQKANEMMPDDAEEAIEKVLGTLTEQEADVVRMRMSGKTLEEVGKEFNVTRERIRQIEAKAFRKVRHPSRARYLRVGCAAIEEADKRFEEEKARIIERYMEEKRAVDAEFRNARCGIDTNRFDFDPNDVSLERMDLSIRSYHVCYRFGIRKLSDFKKYTYSDLQHARGMGRKSLEEIRNKLAVYGVELEGLQFAKKDVEI